MTMISNFMVLKRIRPTGPDSCKTYEGAADARGDTGAHAGIIARGNAGAEADVGTNVGDFFSSRNTAVHGRGLACPVE